MDDTPLPVAELPGLAVRALRADLAGTALPERSPDWLLALLRPDAAAPLRPPEGLRAAVRDVLRQRGYRPTGRGKPSSEYLAAAAAEGRLGAIHPVVDACNAASLHSGLPISVIDLDRTEGALHVAVAGDGTRYVFNASGQEIDVAGLPCLCDAAGPFANAVKDAHRTKLHAGSRRLLAIVWGTAVPDPELPARTVTWLGELLARLSCTVRELPVAAAP